MKNSIYLVLTILFFASCGNKNSEIIDYYTDSIPKTEHFYEFYGNKKVVVKEIRYYPSGIKQSEGSFNAQEKKEGKWTYYFENGEKWYEENYIADKKNGKHTEWYQSGKKMYEANYKEDILDGKMIIWDEKGDKISSSDYKNGKPVE